MSVQALCFDLDDTLIESRFELIAERVAKTLAAENIGLSAAEILEANAVAWDQYWPEVERDWILGRLDTQTLGLEAWTRTLRACGWDDINLAVRARDLARRYQRETVRFHEGASDLIKQLGQRYPLALMTNGAADLQREKLRHLELENRFNLIVISGEHGIAKPDPAVFALVLNEFGIKDAQNVWHIGDNLRTDVGGAKAAGLTAVWLNRKGGSRDPADPEPDYEIASLSGLPQLLAMS